MRNAALVFTLLSVASAAPTQAGSMPALPELPPLPASYKDVDQWDYTESHSSTPVAIDPFSLGAYAGVLAGYSGNAQDGLAIGIIAGHRFLAADLAIGLEGLGFVSTGGELTAEASVRAGIQLAQTFAVFGHAGLGYSSDTEAFASMGTSLEVDVGSGWVARADYRFNHDLSGEVDTHKVLAGLLFAF
jgi:hypothetical protein